MFKCIFFSVFLFIQVFKAHSQELNELKIDTIKDPLSSWVGYIITLPVINQKDSDQLLNITLMKYQGLRHILLSFYPTPNYCFNGMSTMIIEYDNKKNDTLYHSGASYCDFNFHVGFNEWGISQLTWSSSLNFKKSSTQFDNLLNNWKKIRFIFLDNDKDNIVEFQLSSVQKAYIKKSMEIAKGFLVQH